MTTYATYEECGSHWPQQVSAVVTTQWLQHNQTLPLSAKGVACETIERLQGVWPKIISVAMEMPIFYVNFSSLNYPNLKDESLGPYG